MREFIAWQDDFSVGVELIDKQHQRLLQVINDLLSGLGDSDDRFPIGRSLDEMIKYTEYHFYTEQLFLEKHPDFLAHLNQHWQLIKQVKKIQKDFLYYHGLQSDVFDFLLFWLKNHILGHDKVCFAYLIEKRLL